MHCPQSYYCCFFLLISGLSGFTQNLEDYTWPQTFGYFIMENEPELNRRNQVSAVFIFKSETDSLGTPLGSPKLITKHRFDRAGFKIETIEFDSTNNQQVRHEYLEPFQEEYYPQPFYSQILTFDEKDHLTRTSGELGANQHYSPYYNFKPCYGDFLYGYHPSGLKRGALFVVSDWGFGGDEDVFWATHHFTFVYSFFDD